MSQRRTPEKGSDRAVPMALPISHHAKVVLERLAQIQASRASLELVQVANDHADTAPIPGEHPKLDADGKIVYEDDRPVYATYGERYAEIAAQEARMIDFANRRPGVMRLVEKLIRAQAAADEAEIAADMADNPT